MKAESPLIRTIEIKDRTGRVVGTKEVVTYQGLLSKAHDEGLTRVKTSLLQIPAGDNGQVAIAKAEVETSKGIFEGLGDASPENVNSFIVPHLIRMAETRAKARALRDAVNVGVASFEELDGEPLVEEVFGPGLGAPTPVAGNSRLTRSRPSLVGRRTAAAAPVGSSNGSDAMSEAQRRYLFRILAGQGYEREAAEEHLKDIFEVSALSEITKVAATKMIDELLASAPGNGGGGHGGAPHHQR
jgi:hypothetical protein